MFSHLRRRILLSLAFAALVYLALTLYADAPRLAEAFLTFEWFWLPLALLVTLFNYLIRFVRWHYYLRILGLKSVLARPSLLIFLSGFSLTMVPGKLGELLKSAMLKSRYGTPISYSASIIAAERLLDTMAMTLLAGVGLVVSPFGVSAFAFLIVGLLVLVILIQSRPLAEHSLHLLARVPWVGKFAPLARNLYSSAFLMLRWRPILIALVLSVFAWFGECLAFFFILVGFGAAPDLILLLKSTFIYAAASLFGAVTLLPGGIGATEGGMASLLQLMTHVGATISAAATLLVRVCTLWFAIILGGIALLIFGLPREGVASGTDMAKE